MNIELSALEERAEPEEQMADALRILNAAIWRDSQIRPLRPGARPDHVFAEQTLPQ
jgi:hypothetical protein